MSFQLFLSEEWKWQRSDNFNVASAVLLKDDSNLDDPWKYTNTRATGYEFISTPLKDRK